MTKDDLRAGAGNGTIDGQSCGVERSSEPASVPTFWGTPDPALQTRTRFFVDIACEHGVRVSALVFLIAIHTDGKHRRGFRGRKNCWHQRCDWYGEQIGVCGRQIKRLFRQARDADLIGFERTGRGVLSWVRAKRVWTLMDDFKADDRFSVGFYDTAKANQLVKSLAKPRKAKADAKPKKSKLKGRARLGVNASIILDLLSRPRRKDFDQELTSLRKAADSLGIDKRKLGELVSAAGHPETLTDKQEQAQREYRELTFSGVHHRCPWITQREADYELRRLFQLGLIKRKPLDQLSASHLGARWVYYSKNCLQNSV